MAAGRFPDAGDQAFSRPGNLALHDAVALAVRRNPALAALGAEVGIAAAAVEAARGLDGVRVDADLSWRPSGRGSVSGGDPSNLFAGSLALTKPLATGGEVGLGLVGAYGGLGPPGTPVGVTSGAPVDLGLQLQFQHPILRGFGVDVARAQRRRARLQVDAATLQRLAAGALLVRDVVIAYWDLAYATQEREIRRSAAAAAREQLHRVHAHIEAGKLPRSAAAEVEVAIALRDEAALLAEQTLAGRALDLGRLCGQRVAHARPPDLVAADDPGTPLGLPDPDAALEATLLRNPELARLRVQADAAAIEVDVTDNGLLPQLDMVLSAGSTTRAGEVPGNSRQLATFDGYAITAGVVFQQPIERHAARGDHQTARETLRKVRLTEEDVRLQVASAVARAINAAEIALRRADVLARSTEAAATDLEAERARFAVGRSTNFDVLRRQEALAGAQLVHLRARVDLHKALAAVGALTGDILDDHRVALRGADGRLAGAEPFASGERQ